MVKKEYIIELLHAYKSEVDNFNDAIFTDKFDALAQDIVKLFAIPVVVHSYFICSSLLSFTTQNCVSLSALPSSIPSRIIKALSFDTSAPYLK